MQDLAAERAFYDELFERNPENEHITQGYDELHDLVFGDDRGGTVLDLGCGTGAHAVRIARRGYDVIAVDLTHRGVRSARERFQKAGLAGRFVVADAERLPFREGVARITWTSLLLHHFPKLDTLPSELARVTRERLVAFEPNARNLLTWLAFNVVNRVWGISGMTPNQKALTPRGLDRIFRPMGLATEEVHYVDRPWSDRMGFARRMYATLSRALPIRYRANKFLITFARNGG
ncbi:MAG TPA: class I SAM-dependent methyltransferase [Gemmatimonadales bacterium]